MRVDAVVQRILDGIPNLGELDHEPLCAITYATNPHCNCLVVKTKDARLALAELIIHMRLGSDIPGAKI